MGLLDDAIREHLDLKRRRGADPAEIERAEREALGPVRREPIAPGEGDEANGATAAIEPSPQAAELASDDGVDVAPAGETFSGELGDDEPSPGHDWDDYDDDYEDDEDGFEPSHPDPGPDSRSHTPGLPETGRERSGAPDPGDDPDATRAFQVEPGHQPPAEGEDVLEETPDFLQDTPDHDRLWFEQRPPKDFDFDE